MTGVDFLTKWNGGAWGIGDIVRYQTAASWALLAQAPDDRALWLSSYSPRAGRRAVAGKRAPGARDWPAAYRDSGAAGARHGGERRAAHPPARAGGDPARHARGFTPGGRELSRGELRDPHGAAVRLLRQDAARGAALPQPARVSGRPAEAPVRRHRAHAAAAAAVRRGHDPRFGDGGDRRRCAGSRAPAGWRTGLSDTRARRIAIFQNASPSMDEGWTRWVFDQYRIPFTLGHCARHPRRATSRRASTRSSSPTRARERSPADRRAATPIRSRVDSATPARAALGDFVDEGGTVLAFNEASDYAIEALQLPVTNVLAGVRPTEFYAPGSLLTVEFDRASPLGRRADRAGVGRLVRGLPTFERHRHRRAQRSWRAIRPSGDPLPTGWLLGAPKLAGKAALVDVMRGNGHVVLFGFRPQYRAQSMATLPLHLERAARAVLASGAGRGKGTAFQGVRVVEKR